MSKYLSRYALNTYRDTAYFMAQVPPDYPLGMVVSQARGFRWLPPNLKRLSALAKRWAWRKHEGFAGPEIDKFYDRQGYELDPETGVRLTDAQLMGPPPMHLPDIPIPQGGFPDPDNWEEPLPESDVDPLAEVDMPTVEDFRCDVASRGLKAAAEEYGKTEDELRALLNRSGSVIYPQS